MACSCVFDWTMAYSLLSGLRTIGAGVHRSDGGDDALAKEVAVHCVTGRKLRLNSDEFWFVLKCSDLIIFFNLFAEQNWRRNIPGTWREAVPRKKNQLRGPGVALRFSSFSYGSSLAGSETLNRNGNRLRWAFCWAVCWAKMLMIWMLVKISISYPNYVSPMLDGYIYVSKSTLGDTVISWFGSDDKTVDGLTTATLFHCKLQPQHTPGVVNFSFWEFPFIYVLTKSPESLAEFHGCCPTSSHCLAVWDAGVPAESSWDLFSGRGAR